MIYILIALLVIKYRDDITALIPHREVDDTWAPGAGLDYQEPRKERHLRVVK